MDVNGQISASSQSFSLESTIHMVYIILDLKKKRFIQYLNQIYWLVCVAIKILKSNLLWNLYQNNHKIVYLIYLRQK